MAEIQDRAMNIMERNREIAKRILEEEFRKETAANIKKFHQKKLDYQVGHSTKRSHSWKGKKNHHLVKPGYEHEMMTEEIEKGNPQRSNSRVFDRTENHLRRVQREYKLTYENGIEYVESVNTSVMGSTVMKDGTLPE